jgi:uncharacterized protein (UPF0254 family)
VRFVADVKRLREVIKVEPVEPDVTKARVKGITHVCDQRFQGVVMP